MTCSVNDGIAVVKFDDKGNKVMSFEIFINHLKWKIANFTFLSVKIAFKNNVTKA